MVLPPVDQEELRQRAADGFNFTTAGRDMGLSRQAVARRARKLGIEFAHKPKINSIRRAVEDMPLSEAVDFLLEIVVQLIPALEEDNVQKICQHGFTATEAQVLMMLFEGRVMAKEMIYNAIWGSRASADLVNPKIIDVMVCRIRKKIKDKGWNVVIHTTWGRGYRGERLDGFMFPWEAN